MCLYPRLIKNPKYKPNKKNGGVTPAIYDIRVLYVPIGCNNCIECKKKKANDYRIRLLEDIKVNKNCLFVTLTFSNEEYTKLANENRTLAGYSLDNWIAIKAMGRFLNRWRKEHGKSLRHWAVTELGHEGTENIHLHAIIWNKDVDKIRRIWKYGFIWAGTYVNGRTVNYIVKYVTKTDLKHKYYKPQVLSSPGIGANYINTHNATLNKYNSKETKENYTTTTGHKVGLPVYWRNKLYSDEEKEALWIQKLNKNERWVLGQKISIDKNNDNYWKALKQARKLNIKLGYNSDWIDYNEKEYEEQLRILKQAERKKIASGGPAGSPAPDCAGPIG